MFYMKKAMFIVLMGILCFFGKAYCNDDEAKMRSLSGNLQALLDYAVTTKSKEAKLFGLEYRLERPVVLDSRHNGLSIYGDDAVITGAKKIQNWKKSEKFPKAWEADLKYDKFVTSLFINGVRAQCAKTPNDTRFLAHSRLEDGSAHGSRMGMNVSTEEGGKILLSLTETQIKDAFVGTFRNWVQVNVPLGSVEKTKDAEKIKVLFDSPIRTSMFRNCKYPSFVIYNIPSALDKEGEFYFDRANSKIYYIPRASEDMTKATVEFPYLETPFVIAGKLLENGDVELVKNIYITSVKLRGGSVGYNEELLKKGKLFFLNDMQSAADSISNVKVEFAKNISFSKCEFSQTDSYGLWLADGVKESIVSSCEIKDLGLGGVKIGSSISPHRKAELLGNTLENFLTSDIRFTNNAIYQYGRFSMSGAGVLAFDVAKCKIENNEIFDGFYTGISYGWSWGAGRTNTKDTSISFNKIHDLSFGQTNDIGGIYTLGISPNSKIEGNVIWNIECLDYGAWGIYNDEGSDGWSIFNNYVRNSSKGGYFMHYGANCKIYNNIIRNCKDYQTGLGRKRANSFTFERNIIEYTSPATILRGNQLIPHNAGAFNKNIYFNKNGEVKFGELTFEQWQESGQDKDSFVKKIDIDELIACKQGVPEIGFKAINIRKAGIRKSLRKPITKLLKNYTYPPIFKHNFKLNDKEVIDDFIGKYPAAPSISDLPFLKIHKENKLRFVRMVDKSSTYQPYFGYKFILDEADFIKIEFLARLQKGSNLLVEIRPESDTKECPRIHIAKAKLGGQALPTNKWLKFELLVPNHVNPDKKLSAKIFDGNTLILDKAFPYNTSAAKFYWAYFISPNGGNGEITDIAKLTIKAKK